VDDCPGRGVVDDDVPVVPHIPALDFSFASCPSAGPVVGVLVFLMPALAEFQIEPKASPPPEDLVVVDFVEGVGDSAAAPAAGA